MKKSSPISKLMQKDVKTVHEGTSILDAVKLMASFDIGSIVVLDNQNKPVGLFTERDLVRRVVGLEIPMSEMVKKVMTDRLICLSDGDTLKDALHVFSESRFRHLPVINETGKVIGMVSMRDILHAVAYSKGFLKRDGCG